HRHLRVSGDDGVLQLLARRREARHLQERRRGELVNQLTTFLRPALIEDDGRDVLRVHVDDAEEDQLEDRHEDGEDQRGAVARHLRQLFAEHRPEAVHRDASTSLPRVSVSWTKTSSSVGAMSFTSESRSRAIVAFATFASTSRWSDVPKIVAARTYGSFFADAISVATPSRASADTRLVPCGVTSSSFFSFSGCPLTMSRDKYRYATVPQRSASSM